MKWLATGYEGLQCGTRREKFRDEARGRNHLFKVIEHERKLACLEIQLKGFGQWLVTGVANPEDLGDRSRHECRLTDRRQINEVHAVGEHVLQTCSHGKRQASLACSSRPRKGQ